MQGVGERGVEGRAGMTIGFLEMVAHCLEKEDADICEVCIPNVP